MWHAGRDLLPESFASSRMSNMTSNNDPPAIDLLIARLRDGDQLALGELFTLFRPQLRRMVDLRMDPRLAARVAPSDVLQEAYVDALNRYEHYFKKPGASFYVWLRLIVSQRLIDLHRRHVA